MSCDKLVFGPVALTVEAMNQVFEEADHQLDYVLGLYKLVYGDLWKKISRVKGHPKVSEVTSKFIYGKAIDFDKKHHPKVFAGGAWLNNGFSTDEGMKDWTALPADVEISATA